MRTLLSLALVVSIAAAAVADTVTLKNGRKLEGKIVKETETSISLQRGFGTMHLKREHIKSIERGEFVEPVRKPAPPVAKKEPPKKPEPDKTEPVKSDGPEIDAATRDRVKQAVRALVGPLSPHVEKLSENQLAAWDWRALEKGAGTPDDIVAKRLFDRESAQVALLLLAIGERNDDITSSLRCVALVLHISKARILSPNTDVSEQMKQLRSAAGKAGGSDGGGDLLFRVHEIHLEMIESPPKRQVELAMDRRETLAALAKLIDARPPR